MALVRKETTVQKDMTKETSEKDLVKQSVSYQDQRDTESKMKPISSTVEGS